MSKNKPAARPLTRAFEGVDFEVEIDKKNGIYFFTPISQLAYDWSYGAADGASVKNAPLRMLDQAAWFPMFTPGHGYPRQAGMRDLTRFGRSFMLSSKSPRAEKLRTYLRHNFKIKSRAA